MQTSGRLSRRQQGRAVSSSGPSVVEGPLATLTFAHKEPKDNTEVKLTLPNSFLHELEQADKATRLFDGIPSVLSGSKIVMEPDENPEIPTEDRGYRYVVRGFDHEATMQGLSDNSSRVPPRWYVALVLDAYNNKQPPSRITSKATLPMSVMKLPDGWSLAKPSEAQQTARDPELLSLTSNEVVVPLKEAIKPKHGAVLSLSELNGTDGLVCDCYRWNETQSHTYGQTQTLPTRPKRKNAARLKGSLRVCLTLPEDLWPPGSTEVQESVPATGTTHDTSTGTQSHASGFHKCICQ